MSALPAVTDAADAAGLVHELFRNPPRAALALATADDRSPYEAVLRYLTVALNDLPPAQAVLLRRGAAALLAEAELAGYLFCLLEEGDAEVARCAAAVVAGGGLRGLPATPAGGADLHALLLGLCARLTATLPPEALARDVADPRYRDLALFMLASADLPGLAQALPAVADTISPTDEHAVEALGRALREALQAHGAAALLGVLPRRSEPEQALLAGLAEALLPARLALLTDEQRRRQAEAQRRQARERPEDDYLRLSLDAEAREAFLMRAREILEGQA